MTQDRAVGQSGIGHGDLEASAACLIEFTGGVAASASIDFPVPDNPSFGHGDDRIRVMGSDGSIEVRDGQCLRSTPTGTGTIDCKNMAPMRSEAVANTHFYPLKMNTAPPAWRP